MKPYARGAITGFVAGLAVAVGGAIKDAPYEGFDVLKFFRSPAIGAVEGSILQTIFPPLHSAITFFAVVGFERLTTETYKLMRAHVPSKFAFGEWGIPKKIY